MSFLSKRMSCIKFSPTLEIASQAQKLKISGRDIFNFCNNKQLSMIFP